MFNCDTSELSIVTSDSRARQLSARARRSGKRPQHQREAASRKRQRQQAASGRNSERQRARATADFA